VVPQAPARLAGLIALILLSSTTAASQAPRLGGVETLLRGMGFTDGDVRELARGRAVAHPLDTSTPSESAAAGAVLINAPAAQFLREFTHIETSRRGRGVRAIGVFGTPPSPEDLGGFTLTEDELAALRRCRPGDCSLKLPAAVIAELRSEVDWASPRAPAVASALVRRWLFEHLSGYLREGHTALGMMDDKRPPLDLAEELSLVLASEQWLAQLAPAVLSGLSAPPTTGRPEVRDAFYWARVDFGMKPTIRLNHVSVHPIAEAPHGLSHVVATKQIYASHYLRAALELRLLFPRDDGGFLLVMTTRSRNDGMTGLLGFVVRAKVRGRSRDGMARYLQNVKETLESGRRGEIVGAG
jgi:hypothetical protein